jgi:hypothetical protein
MQHGQNGRSAQGTAQVPLSMAFARMERHRRRSGRVQDAWLRSLSDVRTPGLRTPPPTTKPQDG